MLKALVGAWRREFSGGSPGTTDPLMPIGVATMHYGSAEGSPQNVAGSNWAHTANHGVLPNADLPATFFASNVDIGDPASGPEEERRRRARPATPSSASL